MLALGFVTLLLLQPPGLGLLVVGHFTHVVLVLRNVMRISAEVGAGVDRLKSVGGPPSNN